jgi:flagella basal body P-ring formation protein FlgA
MAGMRTGLKRGVWVLVAAALLMMSVPLSARAATVDLPVPRVTLYPGDVIAAEHLTPRAFIAHTVSHATIFSDRAPLIGKVVRQTLRAGYPVPINAVREPFLVNAGKASMVVFESGGLSISINAIALDNGSVGDLVKLRNPDSGVIIQGLVDQSGTVRLGAP